MGRKKIKLDKWVLKKLYLDKNLSPYRIAKILKCSFKTVTNRLIEYKIPLKSPAFARMKYPRKDFDNNLINKAYLIGFRIGDLSVRKPSKNSETIWVTCHTTQKEQVEVIKSIFDKFGKVSVSAGSNGHFYINCYLNNSFVFLLSKNKDSWRWIKNKRKFGAAFIAGYVDAEGNFIINQNKARFKIDSYDFEVLKWTSVWLFKNGIKNKFRLLYKKGEIRYDKKVHWKKDLWRLNINEANSLNKFITLIMPFLRHSKRIKDAKICLNNIRIRKNNGTVK